MLLRSLLFITATISASYLRSLKILDGSFFIESEAHILRLDDGLELGYTFSDFHFSQDFPLKIRIKAYATDHK